MMRAIAGYRDSGKIMIYSGNLLIGYYYKDDKHMDFKCGVTKAEAIEAFEEAEKL